MDDTLKPFRAPFIEWYNLNVGMDIDHTSITEYNLSVCMGLNGREEVQAFIDRYHEYEAQNQTLALSEEAVAAMTRLSQYFHFPVISARKCKFKSYTLTQMSMALPHREPEAYHREDYESLGLTKGKYAKKEIGAIALLDDHVPHVESAIDEGIHGILIADQLNWDYKGRAARLESWVQIEEELMRIRELHINGKVSAQHNGG